MLCDGWLGIVWVVSMSLSKSINSSFARQEGSDIEAIKKTPKPVLAECPQKTPSQNTETWFVYMWRISFSFPPHRGVHYVSACPGWFCAGLILYPNTSLVPTNQDSIWEYFYWCTGTKSHHPTWDVNAIRGIHGFPLDLHSRSKGWAWLRRYSRFISDGNHHSRQEWNYLLVGEGRKSPTDLDWTHTNPWNVSPSVNFIEEISNGQSWIFLFLRICLQKRATLWLRMLCLSPVNRNNLS